MNEFPPSASQLHRHILRAQRLHRYACLWGLAAIPLNHLTGADWFNWIVLAVCAISYGDCVGLWWLTKSLERFHED